MLSENSLKGELRKALNTGAAWLLIRCFITVDGPLRSNF